jgi:hypothetical protein
MTEGDVVVKDIVTGFDVVVGKAGVSPNDDGTVTITSDFKIVRRADGKSMAHAGSVKSLMMLTPGQLKDLGIVAA